MTVGVEHVDKAVARTRHVVMLLRILLRIPANGAVYKGLAFGINVNGGFLFATNFRAGTIDVFGPPNAPGGLFTPATTDGGFTDPQIPAGFAPFGIQNIDGDLFVTYLGILNCRRQ